MKRRRLRMDQRLKAASQIVSRMRGWCTWFHHLSAWRL